MRIGKLPKRLFLLFWFWFPGSSAHRYTQVWRYLSKHMNLRQFQRASFTQRRKENRSSLRETTFSGKDGITRIPRNISTRTDLCITADAGAREPLGITSFWKSEHSISSGNSLIHPKYLQLFLNSRILNWQAV